MNSDLNSYLKFPAVNVSYKIKKDFFVRKKENSRNERIIFYKNAFDNYFKYEEKLVNEKEKMEELVSSIIKKNSYEKTGHFRKQELILYSELSELFLEENQYKQLNPLEILVRNFKKNFEFKNFDEESKKIEFYECSADGNNINYHELFHFFSEKNSELDDYYNTRKMTGGFVRSALTDPL